MATATRERVRIGNIMLAPLHWVERTRGWRRRLLVLSYLIFGTFASLLIWRAASLRDLPDVGDPFDVEAFLASCRVPEKDDAFVLYRRAMEAHTMTYSAGTAVYLPVPSSWDKVNDQARVWLTNNRKSLDLFREGSTRPLAIPQDTATLGLFDRADAPILGRIALEAILEGMRLEAEGDVASAFEWYLAVIRAADHMRIKSRLEWRQLAIWIEGESLKRIALASRNPSTDAKLVRDAIRLLQETNAKTHPVSDNLKAEYLAIAHALVSPAKMFQDAENVANLEYSYAVFEKSLRFYWFMKREPERSQRVARLIFANWLAQCDLPLARRSKRIGNSERYPVWQMYAADESLPEASRAIAPEKLFPWLESTALLWRFMPHYPMYFNEMGERNARGVAMVTLAGILYTRDHGADPPTEESLVPKYLDRVPDLYTKPPVNPAAP